MPYGLITSHHDTKYRSTLQLYSKSSMGMLPVYVMNDISNPVNWLSKSSRQTVGTSALISWRCAANWPVCK